MKKILLFFLLIFILKSPLSSQVVINEISASNLSQYIDNHSDYGDWVELYNKDSISVSLAGFYLSDDPFATTKWQIPPGITIGGKGFQRFWVSGRNESANGHYHTNFKLKQTKNTPEYVVFSNPFGGIIDSVQLKKTQLEHSYGRALDGVNSWAVFNSPSLLASNNAKTPYLRYADRPDFSMAAGFYSSPVTVAISTTDTGATIRYTTDGTQPGSTSPIYYGPINISSTTVLKAITYVNNTVILPSYIEFATYFINVSHTLPVVSIAGTQLDGLANGNGNLVPNGSLEYFDSTKLRKANTYGEFNKHGQDSWVLSQRSLDFISRDEMGYNHSIEEKLFNTSDRTNFQRIILRAAGDDNYPADHNPSNEGSAHLRDAFIHNLVLKGGLSLDVRRGAKCIVYLNGQYWGVYDLRENPDEHDFTDYYYGQDKFNLQYIETWGNTWAEYGGNEAITDWMSIVNFVLNNNMNDSLVWQKVNDSLDATSLVDYVLVNMFAVSSDWLNWNTGTWRGLDSAGQHKRWGYILWDNDATFGHYINYTGIPDTSPNANPCDPEGLTNFGDPYQDAHIKMLNKLRTNPKFEQYYISRQIDLWNTVFGCDNMLAQLDSTVALIDPEMTQHASRWSGTYSEWQTNVQNLRNFIVQRCTAIVPGYISCYNLNGPYDLTVNADPANAGAVRLNSMLINQFPWTGSYFGGIDNIFEALPDSGNSFINWTDNSHPFNPNAASATVKINLTTGDTVVAHFLEATRVSEYAANNPEVVAYPTAFSEAVNIIFNVPDEKKVTIKIYTSSGQEVTAFTANELKGKYSTRINFSDQQLAAGIYLLVFTTEDFTKTMKLVYAPQ